VIPKFISCLLEGRSPPIYGTGKQSRDFIYVEDVAQANIFAALKAGLKDEVFNIGSGQDHTVLELAKLLSKILKSSAAPVFLKPRPGDVFKTLADLSCARKSLGFKVNISFDEGLSLTVKYFKAKWRRKQ